jgi:signal transduction histidine kinase
MHAQPSRSLPRYRATELAFVFVTIAAYVSGLVSIPDKYSLGQFTPGQIALVLAASALYLVLGIYGFAFCRRRRSVSLSFLYFAVQLTLSSVVMFWLYDSFITLMLLPLAGQSVLLLTRRQVFFVCALVMLVVIMPFTWHVGLTAQVRVGGGVWPAYVQPGWLVALRFWLIYLPGLVFVVAFTQIALNERRGRAEVERLAVELGAANARLREYAAQVEELATTKERNRLAREIHDSLGHYLTVVNVQIEASRAVLDSDRPRALEGMRKAQLLTQEGLAEVRRSVAALRASPTETRPLPEALAALVQESRAAGTPTGFDIEGAPRTLTPQAELTLYRAAQEGLTNVRKHAQATAARLTLNYGDKGSVRLILEDDGAGSKLVDEGFGLLGVRERAQLLGGAVRLRSAAGQGFRLEIELPE